MSVRPLPGHEFILTVTCADRPGLVFAVSSYLVRREANIIANQQFDDRSNRCFFMRVHFEIATAGSPDPGAGVLDALRAGFAEVAASHEMSWELVEATTPTRTLIMASRFGHCLNDLLFRYRSGSLNIEVPAIISNHRDVAGLADAAGVPFHHIPVTAATKAAAEERLLALVADLGVELVVLARYMQVLSDGTCQALAGRAINIHHSFLPGFAGAKPYHQAFDRGVKLVGATAHYVTPDLDEGPIIEQDVVRVDHTADPDELAAAGRDVEASVLARAVRWHTERRVLVNGRRTVVFR